MRQQDDLGREVWVPDRVQRVVSLVPSLTESVAATAPELLVGVTDWCTHPADLDAAGAGAVVRVRGTKNPAVDRIVALRPDLVLANVEENRREDVEALAAAGIAVWVTDVRSVDGPNGAIGSLTRMLAACGLARPAWLDEAAARWREAAAVRPRQLVVVPIWRRPWMAVGSDTFTGAVLARLGFDNVLADSPQRYPRISLDGLPRHDLVVLPDEPYRFTADDGPEAFPGSRCALVPGRLLTWYGPSLVQAPTELLAALRP